MRTLRLTNRARADLREIGRYTQERWGVGRRDAYLDDLTAAALSLVREPERGSMHLDPDVRRLTVRSHVLYYRLTPDFVRVLRILHGAMDPARRLRVKE